jgi:hypothetical protein
VFFFDPNFDPYSSSLVGIHGSQGTYRVRPCERYIAIIRTVTSLSNPIVFPDPNFDPYSATPVRTHSAQRTWAVKEPLVTFSFVRTCSTAIFEVEGDGVGM